MPNIILIECILFAEANWKLPLTLWRIILHSGYDEMFISPYVLSYAEMSENALNSELNITMCNLQAYHSHFEMIPVKTRASIIKIRKFIVDTSIIWNPSCSELLRRKQWIKPKSAHLSSSKYS